MEQIKESNNEFLNKCIRILKGSIVSLLITILFLIIYSILLTFTSVGENTIRPVVLVLTGISILIGSIISSINLKKNGLIYGGFVGLIYILFLYLLSSILGAGFSLNLYSFLMIIVSIITGILGGIIGVNLN